MARYVQDTSPKVDFNGEIWRGIGKYNSPNVPCKGILGGSGRGCVTLLSRRQGCLVPIRQFSLHWLPASGVPNSQATQLLLNQWHFLVKTILRHAGSKSSPSTRFGPTRLSIKRWYALPPATGDAARESRKEIVESRESQSMITSLLRVLSGKCLGRQIRCQRHTG